MKHLATVLALLAGRGLTDPHLIDPFDTYMTGVKTHQPERELVRFAEE